MTNDVIKVKNLTASRGTALVHENHDDDGDDDVRDTILSSLIML